jgi:hypothetical protein
MKKILGLVVLALILITATALTSARPDNMHSIEGTWELQSFYNYNGQQVVDTTALVKGYRQIKMFYNGKVMWSRTDPNDTVGRFGYGSYYITDTELVETIEFGDYQMLQALDTMRQFTFELIIDGDTYSQINFDEDGNRSFSENYKKIK